MLLCYLPLPLTLTRVVPQLLFLVHPLLLPNLSLNPHRRMTSLPILLPLLLVKAAVRPGCSIYRPPPVPLATPSCPVFPPAPDYCVVDSDLLVAEEDLHCGKDSSKRSHSIELQ